MKGILSISLTNLAHRDGHIVIHVNAERYQCQVITCWPEGIRFFIHSYLTPNVIRGAVAALQNIRQQSTENEKEHTSRFSTEISCC